MKRNNVLNYMHIHSFQQEISTHQYSLYAYMIFYLRLLFSNPISLVALSICKNIFSFYLFICNKHFFLIHSYKLSTCNK